MAVTVSTACAEEAMHVFSIAAQPLSSALQQLARQSGAPLFFAEQTVAAKRSNRVKGSYTTRQALKKLLFGTGLSYAITPDGAVSVKPEDAPVQAPFNLLPAVMVAGPDEDAGPDEGDDRYLMDHSSTANKMDTPIMQTPFGIQGTTHRTMDDQQAISVQDAIGPNVSAIVPSPSALSFQTFSIRGFNTGNNIYMNGLRMLDSMGFDTNNLQSVDVLKGASAMLYGQVQPGGIVNMNLKRPSETSYYSLQQQFGSYGMYRTTADATGALTPDKTVLYRINGQYYDTGSFINHGATQDVLVAPSLTWHPVDRFKLNLDYQYQDRAIVEYPGLPAIGNRPAALPVNTYLGDASFTTSPIMRQKRNYIGYDWIFEMSRDWSVVNRFYYQYQEMQDSYSGITALNPITGGATRMMNVGQWPQGTIATNLDLRGKFETGVITHSALLGFDYYHMNEPVTPFNFGLGGYPAGAFNIYNPATYTGTGVPANTKPLYIQSALGWTAAYAQDQISFFDDRLHLLIGGRYDSLVMGNGFGSPSLAEATHRQNPGNATSTVSAWNPRVGITYQPAPWLSIYGNFTQAISPNVSSPGGGNSPYPPSYATQYEGGVKMEFFDKSLMVTLAAFDIAKTNVIIEGTNLFSAPTLYVNGMPTFLPAAAESRGVELDITGRLSDHWSVIANYTHDDVWYTSGQPYIASGPNATLTTEYAVAGLRLPNAPADMGNFWAKYDADGDFTGMSAALGVQALGIQEGDNANSFQLPAYAIVNAMASYSFPFLGNRVTAQLNIKNIFDKTYYAAATNRYNILPGTPLNAMGLLRVEF
ncbi:TonB-dependent receptor [Candidatus Methylospira mobilis]|nr:TonB-dependent receptor [Candidatus Methylospira mobilis]WNV03791.1 TonB-dependent receptor [Candidatus Methylospira mobilis]